MANRGPGIGRAPWQGGQRLGGRTGPVSGVSFSPDGKWLGTGGPDGTVGVWAVETGRTGEGVQVGARWTARGHGSHVTTVGWTPDSARCVTGSGDGLLKLWRVAGPPAARTLHGHEGPVCCAAVHPAGAVLVSGSADETVKVWDVGAGQAVRTLHGHSQAVRAVALARDGTVLASGSGEGVIRLWDGARGQCLKTLVVPQPGPAAVSFVAFVPNSLFLLSCSLDSTIRIWDFRPSDAAVLKSFVGHAHSRLSIPAAVLALPEAGGEVVLTGSEDGLVLGWDLQTRECLWKLRSHQGAVVGLAIHPLNPRLLITAGLGSDAGLKVFYIPDSVPSRPADHAS